MRRAAQVLELSSSLIKRSKNRNVSTTASKIVRQLTESQNNNTSSNFSILSCNVAGLRSILKNKNKLENFKACVTRANPNLLCLQETKLQDIHVEDVQNALLNALSPEIRFTSAYWSCSMKPAKLGYSGIACLTRNDDASNTELTYVRHWSGFDDPLDTSSSSSHSSSSSSSQKEENIDVATLVANEGRILTIEYSSMFVINSYVPNSGQGLKRLDYRTTIWDKQMGEYMRHLEKRKPVVLIGDLNVAYGILDIHNFYKRKGFPNELMKEDVNEYIGLSQLKRQAGCTIIERNSFRQNILGNDFIDTFRYFYPSSSGCFSYWSMRAGNRKVNRGLRLDYCIASKSMLLDEFHGNWGEERDQIYVTDSFICDDETHWPIFSDHCPIGVNLCKK
jgi:exodeoxyribonuclease III